MIYTPLENGKPTTERDEKTPRVGSHTSNTRKGEILRGGARNVLLVVAGLIVTVTFQAGVAQPGGLWQDNKKGHIAGSAIYASQKIPYYVFLISNTVALSGSILILVSLTHRFPFHFEVLVATISMTITYASSIFAITPREQVRFRFVLFAAAAPFALRCLLQLYKMIRNKENFRFW
ncbi:PGG domain [Dillenia turbinata]|uniref:PGG domain n=1 Tax=Dillenia turbinata TaxID=194707 RepID=A0AAN8YZA6_9MAGN